MTQNFGPVAWVAFYYESMIFIIVFILVVLSFRKYFKKRNKLILLMVLLFTSLGLAILFELMSELMNAVWGGIPYQNLNSLELWWVGRLHDGRFAFVAVILAAYFGYMLKVNILGDGEYKKVQRILLTIFCIVAIIYSIFVYQFNFTTGRAVQSYEVYSFIFVIFIVSIVYIPFMYRTQQLINHTEESLFKKSLRSLNLMALGFILILIFLLLDQLMLIFFNWTYSVFFYLAWFCELFAILSAYLGYLKPKSSESIG